MRRIDEIVSALESKNGIRAGKIHIVPWLETAAGVVNAREICKSSSRCCYHPLSPHSPPPPSMIAGLTSLRTYRAYGAESSVWPTAAMTSSRTWAFRVPPTRCLRPHETDLVFHAPFRSARVDIRAPVVSSPTHEARSLLPPAPPTLFLSKPQYPPPSSLLLLKR